ncbi:MAG: (d)CMP kinase [Psychroflexus sp.]|nr:(d)CMP kinase [Psychroflexus sp.]MDN6311011.1 (d)CMP kinase [Psychroflexus sp.]
MKKITIAIDGHSSTGKSTAAKELAKALNYIYVDTGAMYRAVTYFALQNNFFENEILDEKALIPALETIDLDFKYDPAEARSKVLLNGDDVESFIRQMDVSNKVSYVAKVPEVRKKLVKIQQRIGEKGGLVMDGRDIGSVVFPQAELKIFMTATSHERAKRRYEEIKGQNTDLNFEEVLANVKQRDSIDSSRKTSPLLQTEDAVKIDNTDLSREEQSELLLHLAQKRIAIVNSPQ